MRSKILKFLPDRNTSLKQRFSKRVLRDNLEGWLFLLPIVVSVIIFTIYPLYESLLLSFREWNPFGVDKYVGLANFTKVFSDRVFLGALKNAVLYALLTVPAGLIWGIGVAILLQNIRWRGFFRSLYFLPTITSSVAVAIFWSLIFQGDYGLLNNSLRLFGITGPPWLTHTNTALLAVSIVVVWHGTGYWMIIFLAGLLDIPQEYLDSAKVDGANFIQTLVFITIPQLTPTIFYYFTNALITVWVQFEIVYVLTQGGPANSTMMPAVHLYNVAWTDLNMGQASAMAWVMAIVIFTLTALNFALSRRWVHYER